MMCKRNQNSNSNHEDDGLLFLVASGTTTTRLELLPSQVPHLPSCSAWDALMEEGDGDSFSFGYSVANKKVQTHILLELCLLNAANCTIQNDETVLRFGTLLGKCRQLQRLELPWDYTLSVLGTINHASLLHVEIQGIPPPRNQEETTTCTSFTADRIVQHCLQALPNLERIVLHGDEEAETFATISSLAVLKCLESPRLKHLECKAMEIVPTQAATPQRLGMALRKNKSLELIRTRCGRVPEEILLEWGRALQEENRTLFYVDIGNLEGFTEAVAQTFTGIMARNSTFRSFECNLNGISSFNFLSLKHMFCMDISDNLIGDEGCLLLANALRGASIQRINLAENGIRRIGASAIAWGISQCKHLQILNICDNPVLQESDVRTIRSPIALQIMAKVHATPAYNHGFLGMLCATLNNHASLEWLNLANIGLSDEEGQLVALLVQISQLRTIFLGRNDLGDTTIGHLYSVLGDDKSTLTSLSLQLNSFGPLGFYTLWYGILRTNNRLQNVQLGLRTYNIYGNPRGQRDLDIDIRLNQAGRIRLLRDSRATLQDWLECLFALADDVDCSFALLREHPALCAFVNSK